MNKITTFFVEAVTVKDFDSSVHISGPGFSGANTLCGITDAGDVESSEEKPNCKGCIEVYESIKKHRPKFKF